MGVWLPVGPVDVMHIEAEQRRRDDTETVKVRVSLLSDVLSIQPRPAAR